VKEHESGARKMNFLFVAQRLDSLCDNFVGLSPTTWRDMSLICVLYPCGQSQSSSKRLTWKRGERYERVRETLRTLAYYFFIIA